VADQTKTILVEVDVDASKAEAGTSKARAALASVGDGFASAREKGNELADEFEVVGLAAGGAALIIGGTLVGALTKFIEQDQKAADATEKLSKAFDELLFTLGNAILGGDNFAKTTDKITGAVGELTKEIDANREEIFAFSKETVVALSYVVEYMLKTVLGVQLFIQAVVDAIQEAVRLGMLGFVQLAEGLADVLGVKLGDNHFNLKASLEVDDNFKETLALVERLDKLSAGFEGARGFVGGLGEGPAGAVSSAKARRRAGGGGGGGAPGDELTFSEAELYPELTFGAEEVAGDITGGAQGIAAQLPQMTMDTEAFTMATRDLESAFGGAEVAGDAMAKSIADGLDSVTSSAIALGVGLADSLVTSFAKGEASMAAWVGGALEGIGSVALALGQAGIAAGALQTASPFFGLTGPAAIAAGSALVALGLGLKAGGAALAAGASGGGGGGAGPGVLEPPRPQALRETEDRDTTIILEIDGQKIGKAMAGPLRQMAELGHLQLATR
jgi:hypothetical protein